MERVVGIGGIFFKAKDPDKLRAWYVEHLGVVLGPGGSVKFGGKDAPDQGKTVWSIFSEATTYFAPSVAPFMINYRVRDLAKMLDQLRRAGATVDERVDDSEYGRFG